MVTPSSVSENYTNSGKVKQSIYGRVSIFKGEKLAPKIEIWSRNTYKVE